MTKNRAIDLLTGLLIVAMLVFIAFNATKNNRAVAAQDAVRHAPESSEAAQENTGKPEPLVGKTHKEIADYARAWASAVAHEPAAAIVLFEPAVNMQRVNDLGLGSEMLLDARYQSETYTIVAFKGDANGFDDTAGIGPGWGQYDNTVKLEYIVVVYSESTGRPVRVVSFTVEGLTDMLRNAIASQLPIP